MFIEHHPILKIDSDLGFASSIRNSKQNKPVNSVFDTKMFAANQSTSSNTYLARPVMIGEHSLGHSTTNSCAPPIPPPAPLPPVVPQQQKQRPKPTSQKAEIKPVFDRDKLLSEVRSGVQLRHTITNDKSAPIGVGRVRSGGYSPPPDTTASTSMHSNRPDAKKPVFYGQQVEPEPDETPAPPSLPPPKAPPPVALLKLGGSAKFDRDKLLNEIHGGVKLRKTVTNDRSAPIGVGIVRNDLSPSPSPIPFATTSVSEVGDTAAPVPPPPPMLQSSSPRLLSPQPQHKSTKAITNPALLKLGGKQPVDRDALMASIRSGVRLRKVEINDRSSPFPMSRDTSPDRLQTPLEPTFAPPPPPLLVPPPPRAPSAEPIRRSRSPALLKLGGKVTVDRDELMRSIRQGVKLRKVVTNDKSSAIINDDDSGVKSPGQSTPSTSASENDVYGSQSLTDLSSIGTSRFSSLSNIPSERPNDLYVALPASARLESNGKDTAADSICTSLITKSPTSTPLMINVTVGIDGNDDEVEYEPETVILQPSTKRNADQVYSSPIPSREQIEAEIPAGSARDRIKLFGGIARVASQSPVQNLNKLKKSEIDTEGSEVGILRMKKPVKDTEEAAAQSPPTESWAKERERATAFESGENSIRKMVRKFSTENDSSKISQPVWCQRMEDFVGEVKKTTAVKRKSSSTKGSMKKKSGTKGAGVRRKPSVKNDVVTATVPLPVTTSPKTCLAPSESKELAPKSSHQVEEKTEEIKSGSCLAVPKVNISKFKERFEKSSETEQSAARLGSTPEEIPKPGRVKKPPWIKEEEESALPPQLPVSCKTEKVPRSSWKKNRAPELPSEVQENEKATKTVRENSFKNQKSSDREEPSEPVEPSVTARTRNINAANKGASGSKKTGRAPPVPSSLLPEISMKESVEIPETAVPPREGVGPYRYIRKTSSTEKQTTRKDSTGSKKVGDGNWLNSVPKPFGSQLSTTGETTTIGADDSKAATSTRQFVFKPKFQPTKVAAAREREEALDGKAKAASRTTKAKTAKTQKRNK